ncbi:GNAT family N-acetyltransferase [Acidaminobacter sp. JC074]|uniref:GNAT family N-acetyltransferase n=1 Tax=Acidaminobacter sp. JC074 TaxID=2530199 RepID=UPI001F0F51EF|nr:GNAT family N-acetyltransferase [Acidaminobacter sp. JC074]MCH4886042.1 GNAT family N-acetyltransferase [Acidaminobacter sp. JC074]
MSMDSIIFEVVTNRDSITKKMENADDAARLLSCGSKVAYQQNLEFLEKWHRDEIPGKKYTISLYEDQVTSDNIAGVLRIWQSPYCDDKWLLEGIEVRYDKRRKGYGKKLVQKALEILKNLSVAEVYLNVNNTNNSSRALVMSLGFKLCSEGCKNSFGHELKTSNHYVYQF